MITADLIGAFKCWWYERHINMRAYDKQGRLYTHCVRCGRKQIWLDG